MITLSINLVLILVALAWHYSLFCGYISDDHATCAQRVDIIPDSEKNPNKESFWVKLFNDGVVMYYYTRVMWKLGLRNIPFAWHLLQLITHLINCYLLYLVLLPHFDYQMVLCAVLFWGINPMINQNVVWVSGRPYSVGLMLALISMLCWQNPVAFIPFYLFAVITNISITFVTIVNYMLHPHEWQSVLYIVSMLVVAFPFIMWKFYRRFAKGLVIDRANFKFKLRKFNTFARVFAYYIWSIFVPVNMGWYHQCGFRYNEKWEKFNIWTLCGYILIYFFLFKFGVAGWIYFLGILPNSNLYATNSFLQDRYTYFASIGVALIIAPYLASYPVLLYCVTTFYITRSYMYSRSMVNDEEMYRANWRNHPKSDYAINNLSYFLIQQKRYEEARAVILRGLDIRKENQMLWYNLGVTYVSEGHFKSDEGKFKFMRALECWKMALHHEPRWAKPAEDLKKLIKLLVDNKVLTINQEESAGGASVSIPPIIGVKEMLQPT